MQQPTTIRWFPVCSADQLPEGGARAVKVHQHPLAVFRHNGALHAVDNRCPHMGYPLAKGSVKDGILVCLWHHWQFDLKSGACFVNGGDDVPVFPVREMNGEIAVGISVEQEEKLQSRLRDRGIRILQQGLKDASPFLIAKAVTALRSSGVEFRDIVHEGLLFGATRTNAGWSSGLAILTIAANLWDKVEPEDQNLFLVHGLAQIGNKNAGRSSRRRQFPFPGDAELDLVTLKRWFRRFVVQRGPTAGPERILMTLANRRLPARVLGDFLFTAATDFYYTGDGHALDFATKTLEALEHVGWKDAPEILRPIVVDLLTRERHEEGEQWAETVPILEDVFKRLGELPESWLEGDAPSAPVVTPRSAPTERRPPAFDVPAFANILLGDNLPEIIAAVEGSLYAGVPPTELSRALVYAAAVRITRFHLKNEGDWHAVANLYSYAHALYRAFHVAPSRELVRGIFHGAAYGYLIRWLNMPLARVPATTDRFTEKNETSQSLLTQLQELADFQKVYEAELVVNQYLAAGYDEAALRRTLAHIVLREDAELHMFQVLEVADAHCDLTTDREQKRIHLLAATRYITAQKVMKGILWSTQNAERLQRGESLSEREDEG